MRTCCAGTVTREEARNIAKCSIRIRCLKEAERGGERIFTIGYKPRTWKRPSSLHVDRITDEGLTIMF